MAVCTCPVPLAWFFWFLTRPTPYARPFLSFVLVLCGLLSSYWCSRLSRLFSANGFANRLLTHPFSVK